MFHHDMDTRRHNLAHDLRCVPHLVTVDAAVPGGTAMHHLIPEGIEAPEQNTENQCGIAIAECTMGCSLVPAKSLHPYCFFNPAVVIIPEWLENILVVDQETDGARKLGPDNFVQQILLVQMDQLLDETGKKALLCDQNVIAGIGNMYADEALFAAQIHPLKRGKDLSSAEVERLHAAIHEVLNSAIVNGGATVDTYQRPNGEAGFAQFFFRVAHRRGESCYECGTPIERIVVRGRGTYFCPTCQAADVANKQLHRNWKLTSDD